MYPVSINVRLTNEGLAEFLKNNGGDAPFEAFVNEIDVDAEYTQDDAGVTITAWYTPEDDEDAILLEDLMPYAEPGSHVLSYDDEDQLGFLDFVGADRKAWCLGNEPMTLLLTTLLSQISYE
jgi:hypothetical protein